MNTGTKKTENTSPLSRPAAKTRRLWQTVFRLKKVIIPVTLVVVLTIGVIFHAANLSSPSYALTSKCTLSILSGSVDVIIAGTNDTPPGTNGMTLDAGNRVKTSPDSKALLTFFDGSTLALEPGTDVEIEQLELVDNQQTITIILKQWTGKTWSHVVKMVDRGSHYEIRTPTAVALVRGTQFLTEVDEVGATKVLTAEGLVSVSAQGEEIFLPVGQQTEVEPGAPPSDPTPVDISEYVKAQEKVQNGNILSNLEQLNDSISDIPDNENKKDNNTIEQSIDTDQILEAGKSNGIKNGENQAIESLQNKDTRQSNDNSNVKVKDQSRGYTYNQSNSNSKGDDNGNGNSSAKGQSKDESGSQGNGNSSGNASGPSQDESASQGNSNGNSNGNASGQSQDESASQGNSNGNSNGNNGNDQNEDGDKDQDNTAVSPTLTPTPTPTPPGKSDKDKPDKDK